MFSLDLLELEITEKCNLDCNYCYLGKKSGLELPLELIKRIAKEAEELGVKYFIITGGEPTLHSQFKKVSELVSKKGFNAGVLTNGINAKEKIKQLRNFRFVQMSLDKTKGKIEKEVIANAIFLKKHNVNVTFLCTLSKENKNQIKNLINLSEKHGIPLGFQRMIPIGNGKQIRKSVFTPRELKEILNKISCKMISNKQISCEDPLINLLNKDTFEPEISTINHYGCIAARFGAIIDANGQLLPCAKLRISDTNITNISLEKAWKNSKLFDRLRSKKNFNKKCKDCKIFSVCRGCRAHAFAEYNDFFKCDPLCFK